MRSYHLFNVNVEDVLDVFGFHGDAEVQASIRRYIYILQVWLHVLYIYYTYIVVILDFFLLIQFST